MGVDVTNVELTVQDIDIPDLGTGELILDGGGARLATEEDAKLLEFGAEHLDRPGTALPYRYEDDYTREPKSQQMRVATLENAHLRATFLLDLGGRLWTLTDLDAGRELLHQPDQIHIANLAIRNAWFAGGVEFNLGMTGHWGLTCSPVNAAIIDDDHLRMWAFERLTGLVWQVDVYLPADATSLYVHTTLRNHTDRDIPTYWWSNVAVPQTWDTRILFDAERAHSFGYAFSLQTVDVPLRDGVDVTYPARHDGCADFFYLQRSEYPWIASIEADGYGLHQVSTPRLKGRKLFTWGAGEGGRSWQSWLSGQGAYAEIQAGLGYTQLEHLRLPAGETWTFTESYGPLHVEAQDFDLQVTQARGAVDIAGLRAAEAHMLETSQLPAENISATAEDWGAVEVAAGFLPARPETPFDFDNLSQEQQAWLDLVQTGQVHDVLVGSAQTSPSWHKAIEAAEDGWLKDLLLGFATLAAGDQDQARDLWRRSVDAHPTADAYRGLAWLDESADLMVEAHRLEPTRRGVAIEAIRMLLNADRSKEALDLIRGLAPELRALPRMEYMEADALVRVGDAEAAGKLLAKPIVLPDLREGDVALDKLWVAHQKLLGTSEPIPAHYDFRMAVVEE